MKLNLSKPDYKFWSKLDRWKHKEAALLLHEIDPLEYKSIRFDSKTIPPELKEAYKTYRILTSIEWRNIDPSFYSEVHPYAIISQAVLKDLTIPSELFEMLKIRELKKKQWKGLEINTQENIDEKKFPSSEKPLSSREKRNVLKAIGILTLLIDEKKKPNHSTTQKCSALQVLQMMLEKAETLGIEIEGLKSFDRKITEALELLEEETPFNNKL